MKLTPLFKDFFNSEKSSGIVLICCTLISLGITNSPWQEEYLSIWDTSLNGHSIGHWINDGLMAIFFLLIGLELEREIYIGELSKIKNSLLPIFAALGGMIFPAIIHLTFNYGSTSQGGAGIPIATDIAFALGVLSLVGKRIPVSLKIFLTALAVIDDLGAIMVIAFFYTSSIDWMNLFLSFSIFGLLLILNRLKVHNLIPYLIAGIAMWYFMLNSGVHATITGVLLAFAIPFGKGHEKSPSYILQKALTIPVAFVILPVFALANTCLILNASWHSSLASSNSLGIILGLLIGKPLGIFLFCYLAIAIGWASLPKGLKIKHITGAGFLGGIGFTMSIFITLLAFTDQVLVDQSKIAIMLASLTSGSIGYLILKLSVATKK